MSRRSKSILWYMFQQIRQFQQLGEAFMMQHSHTAEMDPEYAAIKEAFVASLSPEDRVTSLSPEERLAGLSPEERLAGLSAEERRRLFERLRNEGFSS